jgi:hypothetical protein
MVDNSTVPDISNTSLLLSTEERKKPLKLIENNYRNNLNSDYTEQIEELDKNFKYSNNSNHYWSEPEISTLYGTPLYEQASPSQKIALNHLAWVSQYNHIANSEAETVHYNQITAGSFFAMGGDYETIAHQLEHETSQERSHIHAFYKLSYQTMKALLGKQAFINPVKNSSNQHSKGSSAFSNYQYSALRFIGKMMLKGKEKYHSQYLKKLEAENKLISTSTNGFFHGRGDIPQFLLQFFAFNWGSSPFLASQYYILRYIANMLLKNKEHSIFMYYKKLQKQGEFVPAPTAISHYHFLDEAFHTTTSLFLARDINKHLPKPTAYEKFVVNLAVYMVQNYNLTGLSGVITSLGDDRSLMVYIYKLLQSPLFNMSAQEALYWMEKCFCCEHEGFYLSAKLHQRLLSDIRRVFDDIDYLSPVNREMKIMAKGGSISKAVQNNTKTFKQFSMSVA